MKKSLWWVGVIGMLVSAPAWACSIQICAETFELASQGLTIPANAEYVLMDTYDSDPTNAGVVLEDSDGPVEIEIEEVGNWWKISPREGFAENQNYTLRLEPDGELEWEDGFVICGESLPEYSFSTGEAQSFPTTLGELKASEPQFGEVQLEAGASCFEDVEVSYVDVELELPQELEHWQGVIVLETYVNDTSWKVSEILGGMYKPGESWVGFAKDRVLTICGSAWEQPQEYYVTGPVDVRMRAYILGTDVELESNTLTVNLECPEESNLPDVPNQPGDTQSNATSEGCGCASSQGSGLVLPLIFLFCLFRRRQRSR
ncbi:hypothetical protein FRD01_13150 [Microvenator marinus]|uniref:Uncharacterized protein n=1 Tax=Microvenator marinus TaxID=2600177 RepID=A0A5B8XRA4_9DELT|nr:hypothetical protein [Microvenator marinus]QED28160.1 hypothetical protein FRD01_13150 [Microvenator marinus]